MISDRLVVSLVSAAACSAAASGLRAAVSVAVVWAALLLETQAVNDRTMSSASSKAKNLFMLNPPNCGDAGAGDIFSYGTGSK